MDKYINLDIYRATGVRLKEYLVNSRVKIDVDSSLSNSSENPVQNKIITMELEKLIPKSGASDLTGNLEFSNSEIGEFRGISGMNAGSDYWRLCGGSTDVNKGFLEISTSGDGDEPIYIRQYTSGKFTKSLRSLTLLDEVGNSIFPGSITANKFLGEAVSAESSNAISLINGNEVHFKNKPLVETVINIGSKWSDDSESALISGYRFCNGAGCNTVPIYVETVNASSGIFNEELSVMGQALFYNTLDVQLDTTLKSSLTVNGLSCFKELTTHENGISSTTGRFDSTLTVLGETILESLLTVGGLVKFTDKTNSSTSSTGSVVLSGGIGIEKNIISNGFIDIGHDLSANAIVLLNAKPAITGTDDWLRINENNAFSSGVTFGQSNVHMEGSFEFGENGECIYIDKNLIRLHRPMSSTSPISITDVTPSLSTSTGALTVDGGVGIKGVLNTLSERINDIWDIQMNPLTEALEFVYNPIS